MIKKEYYKQLERDYINAIEEIEYLNEIIEQNNVDYVELLNKIEDLEKHIIELNEML